MGRAAASFCDFAGAQVDQLRVLCERVLHLSDGVDRTVLVELPIGNSIPTKLLEHVLSAAGRSVQVVTIALSRSDKRRSGITREQLINESLSRLELRDTDLVVLADEWNTGANFAKITKYVAGALRERTRFVPIALLAHDALANATSAQLAKHEKLAVAAGSTGEFCRVEFPKLDSYPFPFFWAERDRFSGYRKLQLLGALVSSIDAAIEHLAVDSAARKRAYLYALRAGDLLPRSRLRSARIRLLEKIFHGSRSAPRFIATIVKRFVQRAMPLEVRLLAELEMQFQNGLLEYRTHRDAIFSIEHPSNVSLPRDVDEAYKELISRIIDTLGPKSAAERCVAIATFYEKHEGSVDPADRFPIEAHVPVVWQLDADDRILHDELMHVLRARVAGGPPSGCIA